jgi:GTPase SAR1 family protein
MTSERLIDGVRRIATDFSGQLTGSVGVRFREIEERLDQPVRIAVVGRVKAGKSTLVNALLRQSVAPTDVSECTKVVTWFHYGQPERVSMVFASDGHTEDIQLDADGMLPRTLPAQTSLIAALHVFLDNEELRQMTVIDTPGLSGDDPEATASTLALVASQTRVAGDGPDAIAFVLNESVHQDELDLLDEWSPASGDGRAGDYGLSSSAVQAIGVMTRADQVGDGLSPDPWPVATQLASRQAERINGHVSTVVPVIGLLARTAKTHALTNHDAEHLERLEKIDDAVLADRAEFLEADIPDVPVQARRRLLGLLDTYGLRFAVSLVRDGVSGASALTERLARASGLDPLESALRANFRGDRSDELRARSALEALHSLTFSDAEGRDRRLLDDLRARVARLRLPVHAQERRLAGLEQALSGAVSLPDELRDEVAAIARGDLPRCLSVAAGDPGTLRKASAMAVARWKPLQQGGDLAEQRIAEIMISTYTKTLSASGER